MKCKHGTVQLWWRWFGRWIDHRPRLCFDGWDAETCVNCGHWLSLGPANDDDPRVAVEIRAAELAAIGIDRSLATFESYGANMFHSESHAFAPANDGELAGYLAAAIAHHDENRETE